MADRWEAKALEQSTYVWLPFVVRSDSSLRIEFLPRWTLSAFKALGATR